MPSVALDGGPSGDAWPLTLRLRPPSAESSPSGVPPARTKPIKEPALPRGLVHCTVSSLSRRSALPYFLQAIAADKPSSIRELLEIPGVGARLAEQYGAQIFRILERG